MEIIAAATQIDPLFLRKLRNITQMELRLKESPGSVKELYLAKRMGFSDREIARQWGWPELQVYEMRESTAVQPVYKMIDTCASEFDSYIPYF